MRAFAVMLPDSRLQQRDRENMFQIGAWTFQTKIDAACHVRRILESHGHMQQLIGDADRFARALIASHPNRDKILDKGIRYIYVRHLSTGARRFEVMRVDSSRRDFTWRYAIYPKSPYTRLAGVLRDAVMEQVKTFRYHSFTGQCDKCAEPIGRECES